MAKYRYRVFYYACEMEEALVEAASKKEAHEKILADIHDDLRRVVEASDIPWAIGIGPIERIGSVRN